MKIHRSVLNCLIGTIPVAAMTIAAVPRSSAQVSTAEAILTTVNGMLATAAAGLNIARASELAYNTNILYPSAMITNTAGFIGAITSSYVPWMNQVYSLQSPSAQEPNDQALENLLLSGNYSNTSLLQTTYQSAYGAVPSAGLPSQDQSVTDATDAVSQASEATALQADQSAPQLLTQAQKLTTQAQASAAGTAGMVEVQALALQIQALAVEHKEYAALLRAHAAKLATETSAIKESVSGAQAASQATQTVLGAGTQ